MATATASPTQPHEGDQLTLAMIEQIAASDALTVPQKATLEERTRSLIQRTLEEPGRLWEVWSRLCELAFVAGLDVLATRRDQIAASVMRKEEMVRRGMDLAARMADLLGHPVEGSARLPTAADQLGEFRSTVLDRWQTVDDLAALLIEKCQPSEDRLKALAAAYPPPQSWYDQPAVSTFPSQ